MDAGWLVALTVPWLAGTLWLAGRFLMATVDPAGDPGITDSPANRITTSAMLFVVPLGLAWAAHQAGLAPWIWALYLLPHAAAITIATLVLTVNAVTR